MVETFGISQPVRRREDVRFLTGRGTYADDVNLDGQAYAAFTRSPVAHGIIRDVDTNAAAASPGVLAVFTGTDLQAAQVGHIVLRGPFPDVKMDPPVHTPRPGLAESKVRHVGEPVALVIAQSRAQAEDAADLIELNIEHLPAATEITDAIAPGAAIVWDDAPGNFGGTWTNGAKEAADKAFAEAAHVTRLELANNRVVGNPMEVRSSLASYDSTADRSTLIASCQGVLYMMEVLCDQVFHIPRENMRVVTHDVGGGFGVKEQPYPEDIAILFAAKALDRPVKWSGSRSEHFLSDNQARDALIDAALALDKEGNFLALRVTILDAMGAYFACHGPYVSIRNCANGLPLVYKTPVLDVTVKLVMTHTAPVGPYRGAGREQAAYTVERLIDQAARETGIDPIMLRRQNFIPPSAMPYLTPAGRTYDSGEFEAVMDKAMALADWDGFASRSAASAATGKLRGRGLASYMECVGAILFEGAKIRFNAAGGVDLVVATQSQGQGHETSFAQVIGDRLGLPFDAINLVQGDSDDVALGFATVGSRSIIMAGAAIANTCDSIIEKGCILAAHELEAAPADIEFTDGIFRVVGTDREIQLLDLAARVKIMIDQPAELPDTLDSEEEFHADDQYFPNGCHVCELEIDPDTGTVTIDRYIAVDDVGTVINPMIVHGQVHGGLVQGLGQALSEHCVYDSEGQLVSGSFMDYAMPRARDIPPLTIDFHPVPSPANPLGVKGAGEAGVVGVLPAVMNALADALASRGLTVDFDLPATSEKIWRTLNAATW